MRKDDFKNLAGVPVSELTVDVFLNVTGGKLRSRDEFLGILRYVFHWCNGYVFASCEYVVRGGDTRRLLILSDEEFRFPKDF